ncbi:MULTISPECIES: DUF4382 domain-containing protein [unclassified Salegentibacter]|uniref:DUF4382 domain-containing protein n=1 Tax=Salegentibacter agarivorans TaxID=345907 RepID=A0A1I2QBB7_9FLAO|nr:MULTISPECIES: DUF4382 domain-containing protein [unclassified Salegentibacter]SFG23557.1 protein of unknown function [Salegentibacter agarivorans]|tara:strand:- start:1535 stop:2494 length:960 start_codon:yes stop_codon:yes gene_type:complete
MNLKYLFKTGILMLSMGLLVSCSDDDDDVDTGEPQPDTYNTEVYLTDAPIDNAEVDAVFITVTGVSVNGKAIEGFEKTTVNLSSLQNGETELLGDVELESGTTSEIVLSLDNETDASGEAPANYVLTSSGEKKALATSSAEISITDQVEIKENDDNEIILDFDLRKSIVTNSAGEFQFVSDSELAHSIRAVNSINAGEITGTVSDFGSTESETIVVFAYEDGAYSEDETSANGEGVLFANATASSKINESSGEFEIHFIEKGDYELHFVSFSDEDADGELELDGEVEATTTSEIDLLGFSVDADSEVNFDILLVGLLDL